MNLNFTLILQVISFLILMAVLTRLLYRPLLNFLDRRAKSIRENIEEAGRERERAKEHLERSQAALRHAREEALRIKELSGKEASEQRRRALSEASKEADRMSTKAKEDLAREVQRARAELKKEALDISVLMAEKVLGKEIKKKDQARLIEEGIDEIKEI